MEDTEILNLYWSRDQQAISETDAAYGRRLHVLADRILQCYEDAQECVSDTYLHAWNAIPPQWPMHLFAFLAKICRNSALNRLEWSSAAKRSANLVALTAEMETCIPDARHANREDGRLLAAALNRFLKGLPQESRLIFLRRYWFADSIGEIAARYHISQSKVKTSLHRTRGKLRSFLESEGIYV